MTTDAGRETASETRLRLALSFGNLAIWELDIEKNEVTISPELNRLYGFPEDARPSVADYMSRYAPGEMERTQRLAAEAAARGDTRIELEVRHIWPDGTVKWLLIRAEAAPPLPGGGPRALGVVVDITASKLAEEALRKSEQRLRLSQAAAGIASFELDVATGEMVASDNFWPLWGLAPRAAIHIDHIQRLVLPETSDAVSTAGDRATGTTAPRIQLQIRRADDGQLRWLSRDLEFQRDHSGRPVKMYGVLRDITAAKQAEERQALLTHELQHRIKNILATVNAIASQTMRTGDLDTARENFMSRLRALSEAHNILTGTRWTDASLRSVLEAALAPHSVTGRVQLAGEDMRLTPRMALSMALAVNELATNATKYGSLSAQSGRVEVTWRVTADADGAEPELSWTWHESGGPPVVPPQRRGFGSVLIERVLGADFGGAVTMQYAPSGVIAELRVPVSNLPLPGGNEANRA